MNSRGNNVKVLESKRGSTRFEVWEVNRLSGKVDVLGKVSILSTGNRATYKAVCKVHGDCQCVINRLKGAKLLEWLSVASEHSHEERKDLSREVRLALGVRIRS